MVKLISIDRPEGAAAALLVDDGGVTLVRLVSVQGGDSSPVTMRDILDDWAGWQSRLIELHQSESQRSDLDLAEVQVVAPVPNPRTLICVGLNYHDHAAETGAASPDEPVLFAKQVTCVIGPGATIALPAASSEVDYEAELAVVIGFEAENVSPGEALAHVAGYTAFNDVSARDWQARSSQWMAAKSFATFGPMGPALVTSDEIPDPQNLSIQLLLNGDRLQDSSTAQMIFSVAEIISFVSRVWTLHPGDVIATGTPAGVGFTRKPPIFLGEGDVVEVRIAGIGTLYNDVRSAAPSSRSPQVSQE